MLHWSWQHAPTLPLRYNLAWKLWFTTNRFISNQPNPTCFLFFDLFHCPPKDTFLWFQIQKEKLSQLNVVALECLNGCLGLVHRGEISAWSEPLMSQHIYLYCHNPPSHSLLSLILQFYTLTFHYVSDIQGEMGK